MGLAYTKDVCPPFCNNYDKAGIRGLNERELKQR